ADVLRWGVALCRALEYMAGRQPHPALHRDIKPANLVIDRGSGDVRLVNFGGSTARPLALSGGDQMSRSPLMGTHGYAAPEQYTGQSEPRSDVYALAATLYHLATDDDPRAHPFQFYLERLGRLGQALDAALQLDVAARLDAADLLRRLEGMAGAA